MSLVDSPISRITIRRVDPYGIPISRKGALIALPTTWEQLLTIAWKELCGEDGPLPTIRVYLFEGPRTRLDVHGLGIGGQLYPHTWHLVRDRDILDIEFVNYNGPSKPPKSDVAGAPTTTATATATTTTTTSPTTITTTSVTIEPTQPTESTSIRDAEMIDASTTTTTTAMMETSTTPATTTETTTSTSTAVSTEATTTTSTSTSPTSATTAAPAATTTATSTTSAATTTTTITTATTTTEPVPIHSIEVSVRDGDSSLEPTFFKVHRRKPLNKLMRAYCTHVGVDIKDVRFEYQGIILQPTHTCDILEMQEGAEIVMIHNTK